MVEHEEVQRYHALSLDYLQAAEDLLGRGNVAPAYHAALHALELAVKSALASRMARVPRTHNVGGLLGQEFRDELGAPLCSRVNQLVHQYDAPRDPDWEPPADVAADLRFIADFVRVKVPMLVRGGRP